MNHLDCGYIKTSGNPTPDFKYEGMKFEIGGKNKKNNQGADITVTDSLDTSGNKIPLFTIGML